MVRRRSFHTFTLYSRDFQEFGFTVVGERIERNKEESALEPTQSRFVRGPGSCFGEMMSLIRSSLRLPSHKSPCFCGFCISCTT